MSRLRILLSAVLLASCETEETTPKDPDPRDVFAQELAEIVCEAAESCCATEALRTPSDICTSSQRNDAYIKLIQAERDLRIVDLTEARGCLDRYRAEWTCAEIHLAEDVVAYCPELFTSIPEGGLAPGEACGNNAECSSPANGTRFCRFADNESGGTCSWLLPTQYGDPCADTELGVYHVCAEGSACAPPLDDPTGVRTCGDPGALGDPCFDRFGCLEGYVCAPGGDVMRCQEPIPDGGRCANRIDFCRPQAFCDTATETCKVLPIFDECAGGSCASYELDKLCR